MSSNTCSRPADVDFDALCYASGEKNLGPGGVTAVIQTPRPSIAPDRQRRPVPGGLPRMLDNAVMAEKDSMVQVLIAFMQELERTRD